MTKIRFFLDYEKEEQWVNEMCLKGWHLVKFGVGNFKFVKGEPGEYIYRNEMITSLGKKDNSKEYISFLNETGVELVAQFGPWAYFRKKFSEGPFELYSDTSSKIQYLNRIIYLFVFFALINFFFGFSNSLNFDSNFTRGIGIANFIAALLITFPLIIVFKRRKALKSNLDIFHD
ncbi:hypothetical protein CD29_14045 [Ureibacillus manganicus DSM 26584]|uniref:DUF2812 domain-containing protein n=1 Tax=Ureibacillus manganicus DSM 26584 TaxID=1384049 RepID=A0A0A3HZA8_9BACL|nr:hypothetical protein CD29_14045 [Ureibacillus manganicus DSM 26584]